MIPAFEEHIGPDEDMEALNELAGRVAEMTQEEVVKYKAVLEFDGWKSVERSLWLAYGLQTGWMTMCSIPARSVMQVMGGNAWRTWAWTVRIRLLKDSVFISMEWINMKRQA